MVTPRDRPAPDGASCAEACATLSKLGGCGVAPETCAPDCEDAVRAEGEVGVKFPTGCIAAASTCDEVKACR